MKVLYLFHKDNDDAECEVVHTPLPIWRSQSPSTSVVPEGEQMARAPDSLGFRFAVILAVAAIIVAITAWQVPLKRTSAVQTDSIYRAQHLNLF